MSAEATIPVAILPARRPASRWLILSIVLIAQFMVILDAMVVNVALPSIDSALDFGSASSLQWVVNAYTLLFGGFLLIGGRTGDLVGRQRLFIAGLALFTAASLVNGIAQSATMLVLGRAAQGLGAALVSPAVLSIIMVTFADERERGRALSIFGAIMAAGGATGLLLGGVLTSELSWRWIFYVNLPIGIAGAAAALRYIPNTRVERRPNGTDVAGAATVTAGLLLLVYAIVNAQEWHWGSVRAIGLLAVAAALLAAFVLIELRSREPLVRLGIFAKRTLSTASTAGFLFLPALFASMFFPSLYLQQVLGYSAIKTGVAFLPFPITMTIFSFIGQALIRRVGVRPPLIAGLLVSAVGMFLFRRIPVHGSYLADVVPAFVVMAIGTGLALPRIVLVATSNVHDDESGLASGIVNSSQQIGGALGLAVLATIAAGKMGGAMAMGAAAAAVDERARAMVAGFQSAYTVAGAILLGAAFLVALFLRRADVEHLKAEATADAVDAVEELLLEDAA